MPSKIGCSRMSFKASRTRISCGAQSAFASLAAGSAGAHFGAAFFLFFGAIQTRSRSGCGVGQHRRLVEATRAPPIKDSNSDA